MTLGCAVTNVYVQTDLEFRGWEKEAASEGRNECFLYSCSEVERGGDKGEGGGEEGKGGGEEGEGEGEAREGG